jgi:two-component system sensor histidine kinase CreC
VEQYVQSLTHEMKSPLAAIRGAAELLQEPLPEADHRRFVRNIQTQEHRLTETIDKLLALAEVEQHGWLQRRERVDTAALADEVVQGLDAKLTPHGVDVVRVPQAGAWAVEGDAFLLRRALGNLLDNAIAFSPPGGTVELAVEAVDGLVRFIVRDRGPGVPDYARERVFERFYSLPRPDGGQRSSGLGLPFVREVMRLHGGEATLDNRHDGGAEAVLSLPRL